MRRLVIYIHGKGGSPKEGDHYKKLFPDSEVIGFDYHSATPWEAKIEFPRFYDLHSKGYDSVVLIANSIGAFFSMCALGEKNISEAMFISPIVDMEKLIKDMMTWADIGEEELQERGTITTGFGETLSCEYLLYVKNNPIEWHIPTSILYGGKDNLTSLLTISEFSKEIGAKLTVMEEGEHWFHTVEQMEFLDNWILDSIGSKNESSIQ